MKKIWVGLVFLFCGIYPIQGFSQYRLDSLKSIWHDHSQEDTVRFNAMREILRHGAILSYNDSLKYYSNLELREARQLGLDKYVGHAMVFKCFVEVNNSDIPKSMSYADSALAIYTDIDYGYGIARTNSFKGIIMLFLVQSGAIELIEDSFEEMKRANNKEGMMACSKSLVTAYSISNDFDKRIYHVNLAMKLAEELNNWAAMAQTYHAMADVYLFLGITDEGDFYHEKALEYCKKSGFKSEEINIVSHLAGLEHKKGNYDKALKLMEEALHWRENNGNEMEIVNSKSKRILILAESKRYDEAREYIKKFREDFDDKILVAPFAKGLVDYSEGIMNLELGNPKRAAELCSLALEEFTKYNQINQELDACDCMYEAYKQLGDHKIALEYHEKSKGFQEAKHEEESMKELQRIEFHKQQIADSLQVAEKERLVQIAHEEEMLTQKRNKNIFLYSGLALLVLAGGLFSRVHYIRKSKATLQKEKDRSENLLLNILPEEVAEELKEKGESEAKDFENVTVLFSDFEQFTQTAEKLTAKELVQEINVCFKAFDEIIQKHKIEKIKTIGDAYMAAGGLHVPRTSEPKDVVLAGLEMQEFMLQRKKEREGQGLAAFDMRLSIHTGPVVAGIVGVKKFQYDIWGDTVNTASRMESNSVAGKVNISNDTYELIKEDGSFSFENRGKVDVKGKGEIEMLFVTFKKKTE